MLSFLGKVLKLILVVGVGGLVIVLAINEISAHGWLKPNPLTKLGLAQATWQNGLWQASHLPETWVTLTGPNAQTTQISQAWQQTGPQLTTLKDRGLKTAEVAQTFVQTQLISAESGAASADPASTGSAGAVGRSGPSPTLAPLEQRALDYGRYIYCQAAVKDYEQQHPEVKK